MKIEIKTESHTEWSSDIAAFEEQGEVVEITHNNGFCFRVSKSELLKVVRVLCSDD